MNRQILCLGPGGRCLSSAFSWRTNARDCRTDEVSGNQSNASIFGCLHFWMPPFLELSRERGSYISSKTLTLKEVAENTRLVRDRGPPNARLGSGTGDADYYSGVSGPTDFGVGSSQGSSSDSGDVVGVNGLSGALLVPTGYTSGTLLSNTSVWDNATFPPTLGVTPGTAHLDVDWMEPTRRIKVSRWMLCRQTATPLPAAPSLQADSALWVCLVGGYAKRKSRGYRCLIVSKTMNKTSLAQMSRGFSLAEVRVAGRIPMLARFVRYCGASKCRRSG